MSTAEVAVAGTPPEEPWHGAQLRSTLRFLAFPCVLAGIAAAARVQLPMWFLYGSAGALALAVLIRCLRSPEWLIACVLLYLPISRVFVVPIAPGVNGTNLLFLTLIPVWIYHARRMDRPLIARIPNSRLMILYALLTASSAVPSILVVGSAFLGGLEGYKSWIEQMVLYFAIAGLIKDGAMARRVVVYAMISTVVSVLLGAQEMLEKADLSSIEKSRVLGPQFQPNEYGGFVVTNLCPFIALAAFYFPRLRSLWFVPMIGLSLKVVLATFSRGALLGLIPALFAIGLLRGKKFLFGGAVALTLTVVTFPQLLPQSIADRFGQTQEVTADASEQLDKSSADRLILWQAALDMIVESPLLGKGFGMFPYLKAQYTAVPVPVSDTHNMYLWIASQMGLPALFLFLAISARMAVLGLRVYRRQTDTFTRAIGAGTIGMVAAWAVINMFGSRMQSIETCALFWVFLAAIGHLSIEPAKAVELEKPRLPSWMDEEDTLQDAIPASTQARNADDSWPAVDR